MHPNKISTSRWSNLSKQYDQATRGGVIRSVFCDFAVWMASELCDAQEVIHELLGTGASQNETEYNYTVSKGDVNRERVLEYLLAQGMVI